jgi:hypothetical protein
LIAPQQLSKMKPVAEGGWKGRMPHRIGFGGSKDAGDARLCLRAGRVVEQKTEMCDLNFEEIY